MVWAHAAAPDRFDRASAKQAETALLQPWPTEASDGNVFAASAGGSELTGGWRPPADRPVPWVAIGAVIVGAGAGLFLIDRLAQRQRARG